MSPLPGQKAPDLDLSQFGFNPYQTGLMNQYSQAMKMRHMMSAMRGGAPRRENKTFQTPAPLPPLKNPNMQISAQPGGQQPGGGPMPGSIVGYGGSPFQQGFAPQQQQQPFYPPPPNAPGGTYYAGPSYGYQGSTTNFSSPPSSSQFFYWGHHAQRQRQRLWVRKDAKVRTKTFGEETIPKRSTTCPVINNTTVNPRKTSLLECVRAALLDERPTQQRLRRKRKLPWRRKRKQPSDMAKGKKDACYHKVKSRYTKWPSAYASGALSKCRKVGAANWGKGGKKKRKK
jgi:hypothetical protein